jgi:hypothetical protein
MCCGERAASTPGERAPPLAFAPARSRRGAPISTCSVRREAVHLLNGRL